MNQTDIDIIHAFENLRDFCSQVSLMLRTADGLMQKTGWVSASKGMMFDESSAALDWPRYWLPTYMSRFYLNPNSPQLLVFISVIVGYHTKPELVQQAIVSGGWLSYGTSTPGDSWKYRYARAHLFASDRKDDGTLCYGDLKKTWKKDVGPEVTKIATFGLPLSELADESLLNTKVIDKLNSELQKESNGRL